MARAVLEDTENSKDVYDETGDWIHRGGGRYGRSFATMTILASRTVAS